jgi:hypothetical protein
MASLLLTKQDMQNCWLTKCLVDGKSKHLKTFVDDVGPKSTEKYSSKFFVLFFRVFLDSGLEKVLFGLEACGQKDWHKSEEDQES